MTTTTKRFLSQICDALNQDDRARIAEAATVRGDGPVAAACVASMRVAYAVRCLERAGDEADLRLARKISALALGQTGGAKWSTTTSASRGWRR